ncbi:uncharacterized protein LOC133791891 [Humulus lupulus]|uniref:uncharacterized protein LOC133791891 n=1 Tax=Humulus lupulus TaxID=3486 RepID=UPI002B40E6E9|nr:uncharacterized protein LOC133791891 [Humulus lupulus]
MQDGNVKDFTMLDTRLIRFKGCICVLDNDELRKEIQAEANTTQYSVHPGTTKMYHDLKGSYSRYLPLMEFLYNNNYQSTIGVALYEILYRRKCRSPLHWDELGERKLLGPDAVQNTIEAIQKIRERNLGEEVWQEGKTESQEDLSFDERLVKILDRKGKVLRNKTFSLVKVMWRNNVVEEAT